MSYPLELIQASYVSPTSRHTLLDAISLQIEDGKITTIIGPNGAGKSTLLRLMLGLIQPTSGKVVRRKSVKLGYMPQKLVLNPSLPIRVERFLALSLQHKPTDYKAHITAVLEKVKAEHTQGQSVHTLSGGEWQRVLLARALLQSPDLLMLDEPVQGLDHAGQAEFYRLLRHISLEQGCAVVHVSHDLHLVWDASDHVVCLNKHICCQGAPEHVRSDPTVTRLLGGFAPYVHHHDHTHEDGEACTTHPSEAQKPEDQQPETHPSAESSIETGTSKTSSPSSEEGTHA